MMRIVKCCLAFALGLAVSGCSKESSGGGAGGGGSGKLQEHKKVQLWKDGPYWAETNIGAEKPWDYGYYFWWGDTIGYKRVNDAWVASDGSSSNFSFVKEDTPTQGKDWSALLSEGWITTNGVLASNHDAGHVHWGDGWRLPTAQEIVDLERKCDWTWTRMHGVNGYVVRGRGDYASASIFLPAAGIVEKGTSLRLVGRDGMYLSSVPGKDGAYSWELHFISSFPGTYHGYYRFLGRSVRPVRGGTPQGLHLVRSH